MVLAPEHVIENERAVAKAGDDAAKKRKVVRRKPPEGFVGWSETTFDKLVAAEPEPLTSHFRVSHAMVLGVVSRPGNAFESMRRLIEGSHEPRNRQLRHALRAIAIGRALIGAGIVERLDEPDETGRRYRLTMDLQLDFALDQPLSPLALAALDILDQQADTYALDAVSLIEATLEGPRPVLSAQRFKARGEAVAAMKADGIEYEDRMALLEDVDYPKPLADLIEVAYEAYQKGAPVDRRIPAGTQIGGPGHVRAGDDVLRIRRLLRADPLRRGGAAVLRRRLPGAAPDRADLGPHRGPDRHHLLAGRTRPRRRFQSCWTSGRRWPTRIWTSSG